MKTDYSIMISKDYMRERGHKEATALTVLEGICNKRDYVPVSVEYLEDWGLARQTQQRVLSDLERRGKISIKYMHERYIKLL